MRRDKSSLTNRVVEAFGRRSLTIAQVAEALGVTERATRQAIDVARRRGVKFRRVAPSTFTVRAAAKTRG